jgi:hypothetical protein
MNHSLVSGHVAARRIRVTWERRHPMLSKLLWAAVLAITVIGLAAPASAAVTNAIATFDADEEGFQMSTTSTTQIHSATGGNPDGHLVLRKETASGFDLGTENMTDPDFLGDYAADGITCAGYDALFDIPVDETHLRLRRNSGENGWYYDFGPNAAGDSWLPFDVIFDPTWDDLTAAANGWIQEDSSPSFANLMADVGWIEARFINEGSLIVHVDNVRLTPEPATLALVAAGLLFTRLPRRRQHS